MADNDLALGRIVEFLSKTPIWKDSAVFVTEDDAQGGVDHVDAHRSILLVASPWVKPGIVAHWHSSMGSIIKTIDEMLGLGPLNLEDALAGAVQGVAGGCPSVCGGEGESGATEDEEGSRGVAQHGRRRRDSGGDREVCQIATQAEVNQQDALEF